MPEQYESTGQVKEGQIVSIVVFITYDQASEVVEPCKESFDFPALAIAAHPSTIVESGLGAAGPMWCQQQDVFLAEFLAQRIAVVSLVGDQALGLFLDQTALQGRVDQRYFRGRSSRCVN